MANSLTGGVCSNFIALFCVFPVKLHLVYFAMVGTFLPLYENSVTQDCARGEVAGF
jgi:hypothetical protein